MLNDISIYNSTDNDAKVLKSMPHISVVIPVFKAENCLDELYLRLKSSLESITDDFEIIMIEDCGGDGSWPIILELSSRDSRVKGIQFSRNFGQHYGVTAGLDYSKGDWVVVMDCDLQDRPEELPNLYHKALEGFDMVVGRRSSRQDTFFKKLGSKLFYRIFSYFTGSKIDNRIGNFGIYSRKVINNINRLREQNRSFGLFALWVGFKRVEIDIEHARRPYGKSSYTFVLLLDLAINSIVSYSNKLLLISVKLGLLLSATSLLYAFWLVLEYLVWSTPPAGWTSLIVSVYFTAGLIIGTIGIVGLYVGKMFDEVKDRPLYIIRSTTFETHADD